MTATTIEVPELLADVPARLGRSSVSPFLVGDDTELLLLADGGLAGFVRRGRWAIMATGPVTPSGTEELALDEVLDRLRHERLRPVFAAVPDPDRYRSRGLHAQPIADDATIALTDFSLSGKRRSSIRHSVTSARRAGLRVEAYGPEHAAGTTAVSNSWLSTKRGGEMGFTLGRFDPDGMHRTDCRVAVDENGTVVGFVTWHRYDDGRARVLDIMRRLPDAPNPTMDLLIGESLLAFAAEGVERASLGSVPRSKGRIAERIYPTISLRRYKDKYAPEWQPMYLVAPSHRSLPLAMLAVAKAYTSEGLLASLRRNG
jgi:phosphatidylglycerol lysyltransferase